MRAFVLTLGALLCTAAVSVDAAGMITFAVGTIPNGVSEVTMSLNNAPLGSDSLTQVKKPEVNNGETVNACFHAKELSTDICERFVYNDQKDYLVVFYTSTGNLQIASTFLHTRNTQNDKAILDAGGAISVFVNTYNVPEVPSLSVVPKSGGNALTVKFAEAVAFSVPKPTDGATKREFSVFDPNNPGTELNSFAILFFSVKNSHTYAWQVASQIMNALALRSKTDTVASSSSSTSTSTETSGSGTDSGSGSDSTTDGGGAPNGGSRGSDGSSTDAIVEFGPAIGGGLAVITAIIVWWFTRGRYWWRSTSHKRGCYHEHAACNGCCCFHPYEAQKPPHYTSKGMDDAELGRKHKALRVAPCYPHNPCATCRGGLPEENDVKRHPCGLGCGCDCECAPPIICWHWPKFVLKAMCEDELEGERAEELKEKAKKGTKGLLGKLGFGKKKDANNQQGQQQQQGAQQV